MVLSWCDIILKAHFLKAWQPPVNIWFNQLAPKIYKFEAWQVKAGCNAPCPASDSIRLVVRDLIVRYHSKVRASRGFSLENSGWLVFIKKKKKVALSAFL